MIKEFKNLKQMKKYYDKKTNTYIFKRGDVYIDLIKIDFDLSIDSNIDACNIDAQDIEALNIDACNIDAYDIEANDIFATDINANDIGANDIDCNHICANDIIANDIDAKDISSHSIEANNIEYFAICYAYQDIVCNSIRGYIDNSKHFSLKGKVVIKDE